MVACKACTTSFGFLLFYDFRSESFRRRLFYDLRLSLLSPFHDPVEPGDHCLREFTGDASLSALAVTPSQLVAGQCNNCSTHKHGSRPLKIREPHPNFRLRQERQATTPSFLPLDGSSSPSSRSSFGAPWQLEDGFRADTEGST